MFEAAAERLFRAKVECRGRGRLATSDLMGHNRRDAPTLPAPADPATSGTRIRVGRVATPSLDELQRLRLELAERYSAGDYGSALALADELETRNPHDPSAESFARDCRRLLEAECLKRIGSLEGVPVLALSIEELRSRALDHRAGFLVSRVDGASSVEMLLDIVPMRRERALQILADLVEEGILRMGGR
jgi:hypothetical protein